MVRDLQEGDELIERAARALKVLPAADPRATARIVAAGRARRLHAPSHFTLFVEWLREPTLSFASAGFLAAAALVVGFVTRGAMSAIDEPVADLSVAHAAPLAVPVMTASGRNEARAVPVPIVFESSGARRVSVVGDFNNWDASVSPMKRIGTDGPWTATVFAKPGRHAYSFLVDDATLVADPRAPVARDLDYGGATSVLMVVAP